MRSYLLAFGIAALIAILMIPLIRVVAARLGAVSPAGGRHVHGTKIPRLGGLAIAVAFSVPVLAHFLLHRGTVANLLTGNRSMAWTVVVGGLVMCTTGAWDDIRNLGVKQKLIIQILAATAAFLLGFRIRAIDLPFLGVLDMGVFALPVTVLWIVGITNAFNLIDGLDGLAGGVAFFAALTNFIVALTNGNVFVALMMAALAGAVVGFLIFNFNPAWIFMGDSGSYFLGYVLALSSLAGVMQKASTAISLLVPILALGVPIFDTLFSIVRRSLERRPIFSPDRGHIHHRLMDLGLTHRRAVLMLYGVCAILTAGAIAVSAGKSTQTGIVLIAVTLVIAGLMRLMGGLGAQNARTRLKERIRDEVTERLRTAVPQAIRKLEESRDVDDVQRTWKLLVERVDLVQLEVVDHSSDAEASYLRLDGRSELFEARDLVTARYPIGTNALPLTDLKFAWRSESETVNPQVEILLQLVVDASAVALNRCKSPWLDSKIEDARLESEPRVDVYTEVARGLP